eukprot:TRINITY_DN6943_c0_g1_i1.p1 TRINITY_DN6943_c0_g1~~TRINITY_DN6943_c0_g1_i1.p1  ORF type:complete len:1010 (+),score=242.58 TRINITY_DN6943_c0_g1_i1:33-3032(+)
MFAVSQFVKKSPQVLRTNLGSKWILSAAKPINSRAYHITSALRDTKQISQEYAPRDTFERRHIGPRSSDVQEMLKVLGLDSLNGLMDKIIPKNIRLAQPIQIDNSPMGENEALLELQRIARKNRIDVVSLLGMGYHNVVVPPVILRNILENPAWYTPYTPYQAEVSQGRLESLLNFQTMVSDLTGLEYANASLLDEATAAAEAMTLTFGLKKGRSSFFVSELCHPQTIAVIRTRAEPVGIRVVVGDHKTFVPTAEFCGGLVQYPRTDGVVEDYKSFIEGLRKAGATAICATELMALTLLKSPKEIGFDIAVGSAQRFGVPPGYGGPYAAFMATVDALKRSMPGRIIGVSKDAQGKQALRMSMQTREQHIRREKATSNICTAQALLANMAAMYAVYHGPQGLKDIAQLIHKKATGLAATLRSLGYKVNEEPFFDTVKIKTGSDTSALIAAALEAGFNLRALNGDHITITIDEPTSVEHLQRVIAVFAKFRSLPVPSLASPPPSPLSAFLRSSEILVHPIFRKYHSETEMLRYMYRLQLKDIGLTTSMIPLGSCTMKLNATTEMIPVTWPEFGQLHPFVPLNQAEGYKVMFDDLSRWLGSVTGFPAISLQPNAGSQGEYAGLAVIRKYHQSRGQSHRNVCLIPVSAHGTNPASAVMAGMKVVPVACDTNGNVDVNDLSTKAQQHAANLSALMITYPSTHGVFEESVKNICEIIHKNGGQVYMDGANMNAQVGFCSPAAIGADVCHLNLHKTFCIPHGGGGPGMGPIGVAAHLASFLPSHPVVSPNTSPDAMGPVSGAPWSSASILTITWAYIKMMGGRGLEKSTQVAILNANYMAKRLESHYPILYRGKDGLIAHEFIIDLRSFKKIGIEAEDVAKRLMDYGFHAPTMSFPVANTLMVEPTESESREELDRFVDALINIRGEIRDIEEGKIKAEDSPLAHAPHTQDVLIVTEWNRKYTREQAAYPLPYVKRNKWWPTVSRIDNVYGDRNLVCSCPPISDYE